MRQNVSLVNDYSSDLSVRAYVMLYMTYGGIFPLPVSLISDSEVLCSTLAGSLWRVHPPWSSPRPPSPHCWWPCAVYFPAADWWIPLRTNSRRLPDSKENRDFLNMCVSAWRPSPSDGGGVGGANTTQALGCFPIPLESPWKRPIHRAGSPAVFTHAQTETAPHVRYVDSCKNVMWKLA